MSKLNIKRSFIAAVSGYVLIVFGVWAYLYKPVINAQSHWEIQQSFYLERSSLMTSLSKSLGYGGLIHNFKNYVLRRDVIYLNNAIESADTTETLILKNNQSLLLAKRNAMDLLYK